MLQIDANSEFGARVARRLASEPIIWLTTVGADLTAQPVPVWFWWDGQTALIYSKQGTPKLRNIARSPRVALHFNNNDDGGDIVVFAGTAQIDQGAPALSEVAAYIEKYAARIARMGQTAAYFAQEYSVAIHVTPTGLRGF